jgi:branched-chain amino acid aminotransferase
MKEKELVVNIDGELVLASMAKISVFDHGLLYGDGVFEGIRFYKKGVFLLSKHIDRLFNSAKAINLKMAWTKETVKNMIMETIIANGLLTGYIRLVVTRGKGDLGLDPRKCPQPTIIIITEREIKLLAEQKITGAKAIISSVRRDPVDATSHEIKSLNYLNSILAKMEATNAGADEAICLNSSGFVVEGVAENIFIVNGEIVTTPPISAGCLPGLTRELVKNLAEKLGYKAKEENITPTQLYIADEIFFTGTAAEIVPVREINGRIIGEGKPGTATIEIMRKFQEAIEDPILVTPIST